MSPTVAPVGCATMWGDDYVVREATPADRDAVIRLCRLSLGWSQDDPDEAFFSWKHDENAFGVSPAWLAVADGQVVGVRVFMQWRFRDPSGSTLVAVRAVDTATDPDWQGRGIFTQLTLGALPDLRSSGVDFVFNTPNDKSRPGYLKMGWSQVGRVPVAARGSNVGVIAKLAGARTAADRWSVRVGAGMSAPEAFADEDELERLLRSLPQRSRIHTDRTVGYLRWRYSFGPLAYRVLPLGDRLSDGLVVFRVRRRGSAVEGTVCDVLVPSGSRAEPNWKALAEECGADFMLRAGHGSLPAGYVPVPGGGPILTWKPICRHGVPAVRDVELSLGDLELF